MENVFELSSLLAYAGTHSLEVYILGEVDICILR